MQKSSFVCLIYFFLINAFSNGVLAQKLKEVPVFSNDSIKLTTIKKPRNQTNFDESSMIIKIEDVLSDMDYNVISSKQPIRTGEYEAFKLSDTIKFLGIRLKVYDTPILVRHDIMLDKLDDDTIEVWLKSFVLVKPNDSQITIDESTELGKSYSRKKFKRELRAKIKSVIKYD